MPSTRLAVFDLDGTLIDSRRDLADSANVMLAGYGARPLDEEHITSMVGCGAATLVKRVMTAADLDAPLEEGLARFLAAYDERLTQYTRPYNGIPDLLDELRSRAVTMALLTNKPLAQSVRILAPDGYTLFGAHDFIHSVYFAAMTDIKYDAAFEPVCMVSATPSVITVGAKTPWKTFKELVEDAKKRPDQIVVGASLGSTSQYSIALAAKAAGISFKYVPYDGTAKRMNALLGGHIDIGDSNLTQKGKVDAGLLRFLANMSEKRTTGLEDVPTMKELGYDVTYSVNRGIMVPKGTPAAIIAKLNDACAKATKEPEFAKAMLLQGTEVYYLDPKGYADYLKKTDVQTKDIAKSLGLLKRE